MRISKIFTQSVTPALFLCIFLTIFGVTHSANAQEFDDYSNFTADPIELDEEATRIFGRFFQNNFFLGTGIFTGDLGAANSAGFMIGMRFVFFFDKVWAIEMGGALGKHSTLYDQNNTNSTGINIPISTTLLPFSVGFRYGFDQDLLPQGFAAMNPYIVMAGELMYRSESISETKTTTGLLPEAEKFAENDKVNTTALGVNIGAGVEFDVYKNQILMGFDLRYHLIFWPDAGIRLGDPASSGSSATALERSGSYITLLGTLTYNY